MRIGAGVYEAAGAGRRVRTWIPVSKTPREAQVVLPVLALAAANDWLQTGFTTLCAAPAPKAAGE
jgi:hypothetical protein